MTNRPPSFTQLPIFMLCGMKINIMAQFLETHPWSTSNNPPTSMPRQVYSIYIIHVHGKRNNRTNPSNTVINICVYKNQRINPEIVDG